MAASTRDPVCGMPVDSTNARAVEHDGVRYCFCSEYCLQVFRSAPAVYVARAHDAEATRPVQVAYLSTSPRSSAEETPGRTPVEAVLAALGSCQAIVYRAYASVLGVRIDRIEVDARGDLDVRGFLNLAPVAPGFERVTFRTRVVSPEPAEKVQELARLVEAHCPVLDILRTPIPVSGTLEHVAPGEDRAAA